MSKELGELLKKIRKSCELTQKQVADILHLERTSYTCYESGRTEPDLKSLCKLAKIFNVPVEIFLPKHDNSQNMSFRDVTAGEKKELFSTEFTIDLSDEKIYTLSKEERGFVAWFRTLTVQQKEKLRSVFEGFD